MSNFKFIDFPPFPLFGVPWAAVILAGKPVHCRTSLITESSFPIELAGVYSTVELGAAHFQLSQTQLDPIPEALNVKMFITVSSTKLE